MQEQNKFIHYRFDRTVSELYSYINYLYKIPNLYSYHVILNQIYWRIQELHRIKNTLYDGVKLNPLKPLPNLPVMGELTVSELAKYNGKNGNLAYVAVNGNVYDVTSMAAWAAATHFGLKAGNNLTKQFSSCHPNSKILENLKLVGKLIL